MSATIIERLLSLAGSHLALRPGQTLFCAGDAVRNLYVVVDGQVRLVRHQANGAAVVLQRAHAGELLAEASLFASRYHCDAVAEQASQIVRIDKARVLRALHEDPRGSLDFASHLAGEVQGARARAELLSLRTVGERLQAWQALNGELPPRGRWIEVAREIGVTPEALYRVLSNLRAKAAADPLRRTTRS